MGDEEEGKLLHHENIFSPQQSCRTCTQISNSARKGKREVTKKSCLSKLSKSNPSELECTDICTYKNKSHSKQILCNNYKESKVDHFGNATIEGSSPPCNREISKVYSSIVWFCQKVKRSQKKTATDFKIFFRQTAPAPRQFHL